MSSEKKPGTPVLVIAKEIVTAALGLVIIIATLVLLWPALSASPTDVDSAQGIFSILGGWGGVVLGYYFGRMPAERAAARAEETAAVARKEKDDAERIKLRTLAHESTRLAAADESLDNKADRFAELEESLEFYKSSFETIKKYLEKQT